MEKNILFPKLNGFVHGGDYNPEQWLDRLDILEEDIRMMKKCRCELCYTWRFLPGPYMSLGKANFTSNG